jgi:hypothetical protein
MAVFAHEHDILTCLSFKDFRLGGGLSTKLSTYPPLFTTFMEKTPTFHHFLSIL